MKGDFTRSTFKRKDHYRSVRMQQGRVQLDSDWNEQADINNYHVETDMKDVVGRCGAPFHKKTDDNDIKNFEIKVIDVKDFEIAPGHIYVNGILCENDPVGAPARGSNQPDLPLLPEGVNLTADMPFIPFRDPPMQFSGGKYLAFLDVWQRHITYLDDAGIREVALGGPDTATRAKTVWQVKLLPVGEEDVNCLLDDPGFNELVAGSTGKLSAKTTEPGTFGADPCILPSGGGYRRLKNQLYRVEIHDGGDRETATFKWSRDNGTVVVTWKSIKDANKLTVIDPGRGILSCFAAGKWVELTDDIHELWGLPGKLVRLAGVSGELFTIDPASITGSIDMEDFPKNPKVRLWDSEDAEKVSQIPGEDWVQLGDEGIQVRFETGTYRTGDYWLIPARTEKADIEWPLILVSGKLEPEPQEPHGIKHHYCRLALLEADEGGSLTLLKDCRKLFPALTELTSLFYVSGDGQEAMPGEKLPEPLEVGVANGQWPVKGALVKFEIEAGGGTLTATDPVSTNPDLIVKTGDDGVAQCELTVDTYSDSPGNTPPPQRVKATLVDANMDEEFRLPVFFNANLSVASQVAYLPPTGCTSLAGDTTVKKAIDKLALLTSLSYMSGDGQEAMPGEPLPRKLAVIVTNECGPVNGAIVKFEAEVAGRVAIDKGALEDEDTTNIFTATTDMNGIAECYWQLDKTGSSTQTLTATLESAGGNPTHAPTSIIFTARLSIAAEVAYDPLIKQEKWKDINETPDLGTPPMPDTVQAAIDDLVGNLDSDDIPYRPPECGTDANPTVRSALNIPADEDSKVAGILDKLLCDFNATHLPILKDGSLCEVLEEDENVKTVQQALNALCKIRRGSGCCTVVGTAKDIGETFNNLKDGDVICLLKGEPYDGDIKISRLKNIVIRGCSGGSRLNSNIRITDCSNVTLENLEISGSLISKNVKGLSLRKNIISLDEGQNFDIISCANVRIEKNIINSRSVVYFYSGNDIEFFDNTIDYNGSNRTNSWGIFALGCTQLKIRENRLNVDASVIGENQVYTHIEIQKGQHVEISGNYIQTKISGTIEKKVIFGVYITYLRILKGPVLVNNNTIEGSNGWAIYVYQSEEVRIQGNNISGSFGPDYCAVSASDNDRLELLDNDIASDHRAIEVFVNRYLNMGNNRIETSAISFTEDTIKLNAVVYVYDLTEGEITGNQVKIAYSDSVSNESVWGLYIGKVDGFLSVNRNRIDGLNGYAVIVPLLDIGGNTGIFNLQGNLFNSVWYNEYIVSEIPFIYNVFINAYDISFIGNRCVLTVQYIDEKLMSLLKEKKIPSFIDVVITSAAKGTITATGNRCVENLADEFIHSIAANSKAAILLGNITTNKINPQPDPLKLNLIG